MTAFFPRNFKREYPVIASAKGVWMTDTDGRAYLDGCSGAVVSNLGHGLPEVIEAVTKQLGKAAFAHTSQFLCEPALELSQALIDISPESFHKNGRVFYTTGGSEAVESAIKMARAYFVEVGDSERNIVISRWGSYHGATLGALSASGNMNRRKPFLPILAESRHIGPNYRYRCKCGEGPGSCTKEECDIACANELEEAILKYGERNVMAFIGEPIVGATLGAAVPGDQYWRRIREICTRYGVLLIADEVMTGLGRVGANFGMELWNVTPDIVVLGKGMAAGYQPLAAVIANSRVVDAFVEGSGSFAHGLTYSGHPAACAAGLACLRYIQRNNLVERVGQLEAPVRERLESLKTEVPFVGDVRGRGLLFGVELVADRSTKEPFAPSIGAAAMFEKMARENGLLVYPGSGFADGGKGDHIMIAPPFLITDDELNELFKRLAMTCRNFCEVYAKQFV